MITEILITEAHENGTIQQYVAETHERIWDTVVGAEIMQYVSQRVIVTNRQSPQLLRTPLVDALREMAGPGPENALSLAPLCAICGHECVNIGTLDNKQWWQCTECNWVSGRTTKGGTANGG